MHSLVCTDVSRFYPVTDWLFIKYLKVWSWIVVWAKGVIALGLSAVHWLAPRLAVGERFVLGTAFGVYTTFLVIFLGGLLGSLGPLYATLMPLAMLLVGWRHLSIGGLRIRAMVA